MPIDRFFLNQKFQCQDTYFLEDEEFHHMTRVMRHREGDEVELVNGKGALATAKILEIGKKKARLNIEALQQEPPSASSLLLAIPWMRPAKLQWIIEKGTELGVS
ncbi:MAG: RsmE family RNA methyltransferase, partial [Chlamydiia bacterium]|nr:RsmE family RNA methyltransferase [Chlamydiia bacterium]